MKGYVAAHILEVIDYSYEFEYKDQPGCGFSFECDKDGNLLDMADEAKENYRWCLDHEELFDVFNEFTVVRRNVREDAHGICVCGVRIELWDQYQGACECPNCGRWYNLFGQRLIDPQYWGLED